MGSWAWTSPEAASQSFRLRTSTGRGWQQLKAAQGSVWESQPAQSGSTVLLNGTVVCFSFYRLVGSRWIVTGIWPPLPAAHSERSLPTGAQSLPTCSRAAGWRRCHSQSQPWFNRAVGRGACKPLLCWRKTKKDFHVSERRMHHLCLKHSRCRLCWERSI